MSSRRLLLWIALIVAMLDRVAAVTASEGMALKHLPIVSGLVVSLPGSAAQRKLANIPGLIRVEPDIVVRAIGKTPAMYATLRGTFMAAPHVTVALVI